MVLGDSRTGTVTTGGEVYWYPLYVKAGDVIDVGAFQAATDGLQYPRVTLYDPTGTSMGWNTGWGYYPLHSAILPNVPIPETGLYTVEVKSTNTSYTGSYTLKVRESGGDLSGYGFDFVGDLGAGE